MSRAPQEDPRQDTPAISAPTRSAAGIPAVINSLRVVSRQSGAARGLATLRDVNQKDGFDCPGCAWPEPASTGTPRSSARTARRRSPRRRRCAGSPASSSPRTRSPTWPAAAGYWLGQQGRLTQPMYLPEGARPLRAGHLGATRSRIIAEELAALDSPDEAVFYTSGRTSNEAAFLYQLFARELGTNNLPDCSNMCHESSGVGADRDDRHRQGQRPAGGPLPGRSDHRGRPEPGHQPPADAVRAGEGQARRRARSSRSTRCPRRA